MGPHRGPTRSRRGRARVAAARRSGTGARPRPRGRGDAPPPCALRARAAELVVVVQGPDRQAGDPRQLADLPLPLFHGRDAKASRCVRFKGSATPARVPPGDRRAAWVTDATEVRDGRRTRRESVRASLCDALLELVEQMPFKDILVDDLARAAGIKRSAFTSTSATRRTCSSPPSAEPPRPSTARPIAGGTARGRPRSV